MAEHDGRLSDDPRHGPGEYADRRVGEEHNGLLVAFPFFSTDERDVDPSGMVCAYPSIGGEYAGWVPRAAGSIRPALEYRIPIATPAGHRIGPTYPGRCETFFDGMFNARDKLARIGVVVSISGTPLANTDVILNGLEHREIVKTDHRGIWWKYLEIDEYPDALFISPNGITYDLLKQIEREDNEGIFDQMVQRRTLANVATRMLHRKFV